MYEEHKFLLRNLLNALRWNIEPTLLQYTGLMANINTVPQVHDANRVDLWEPTIRNTSSFSSSTTNATLIFWNV